MRRLLTLLVVALGLAPGTWWRSPSLPADKQGALTITRLAVEKVDLGPLKLAGAWQLDSASEHFHGYSALVSLGDGTLLAVSDRGRMLRFAAPGRPAIAPQFDHFAGLSVAAKRFADIESATRDPETGRIWAGFEVANRIGRYEPDLTPAGEVSPSAMAEWSSNSGPEAMARLADGRFVVLSEGDPRLMADGVPGLLFTADPVAGGDPIAFRFMPPEGYSPVDMAQLPDGRVLILLRTVIWGLPPRFAGKLVIADPADITAGREWRSEPVADLAAPLPMDNYEGLAVEAAADGSAVLWLVSDDNEMLVQRTLLLKLIWRPNEKARDSRRTP